MYFEIKWKKYIGENDPKIFKLPQIVDLKPSI